MSLFYITLQAAATTTATSLWKIFKPSNFESLNPVTSSYLYRANDLQGAGKSGPEWMIMYEMADAGKTRQPITLDNVPSATEDIKIFRQGLYRPKASKTSQQFSSLDWRKTPENHLVAVFLRLDPSWKAEYDRYYTEEHMDAIAQVPGWRRTRRLENADLPEGEVELAQLHDYDMENGLSGQQFSHATSTKWYKDMMANAVLSKDRRTYELVSVL